MIEKATFAAGCFWGIESAFRAVPGVVSATSGYIGGHVDNPTYQQVCTGRTGHAEAVEVEFDPAKTSFALLLQKFFSIHDPTQVDRQGPDIGSQYRTAIFTHSPEQAEEAKAAKAQLDQSGIFRKPIATEIVPAGTFWRAEEYHQRYDEKHGRHCAI
jgi:peptide-methionine (S)-S-oxide reductase